VMISPRKVLVSVSRDFFRKNDVFAKRTWLSSFARDDLLMEMTPNPNARRFVAADGSNFLDSPLMRRKKEATIKEGVESGTGTTVAAVLLAEGFVSVTLREEPGCDSVWEEIQDCVRRSLPSVEETAAEREQAEEGIEDVEDDSVGVLSVILEVLDERVRPNLNMDGGDVQFRGFDEETGVVKLRLIGSCVGCPSSTVTLKFAIKNLLTSLIDEVKDVEQVFDAEDDF